MRDVSPMDLSPYTCRGFRGDFDRVMADVPVRGIDRQHTLSMVRLCEETEGVLYGAGFSSRKIRYRNGARPGLEAIVANFAGDPRERVRQAMQWTRTKVVHAHFIGELPPDR